VSNGRWLRPDVHHGLDGRLLRRDRRRVLRVVVLFGGHMDSRTITRAHHRLLVVASRCARWVPRFHRFMPCRQRSVTTRGPRTPRSSTGLAVESPGHRGQRLDVHLQDVGVTCGLGRAKCPVSFAVRAASETALGSDCGDRDCRTGGAVKLVMIVQSRRSQEAATMTASYAA
jgi:hypothetical protein